ncbi:MAG TPA: AMP-binding protein [Streptosporangiaceae bacterium]
MNAGSAWTRFLGAARADTGIILGSAPGRSQRLSYAQLAELASAWAAAVTWDDAGSRDSVLIIATPCAALFGAFFGLLSGGADVCLVAPPAALADGNAYARHLGAALAAVTPRLILCQDRYLNAIREATGGQVPFAPLPPGGAPDPAVMRTVRLSRDGAGGDLLQLTSGSTTTARCVQLAAEAVTSNVAGIVHWLSVTSSDAVTTWLPLYHDMGLIGTFLMPISQQIDLYLMDAAQFVRNPAGYLSLFGKGMGTLTAMPPFGLDYLSRRIRDNHLAGLDLSGWRALIVAAERIPVAVLDRFCGVLERNGFASEALCPAYGLAEATCAVTGSPPGEALRLATLSGDGARYVSCGRPLPGVGVRVTDGADRELTGRPGEIVVTSPALARHYRGASSGSTRMTAGELRTGDAGFLDGGELYVIGRLGDAVKVRGTWLFAEDLEARFDHPAFSDGGAVLAVGQDGDLVKVLLVRDRGLELDTGPLDAYLRAQGIGAAITDVPVSRRDILRTSSGKPRRREMWLKFG